MELGAIHQLFGQARSSNGDPLYEVVTCTPRPGAVRTDADFPIQVSRDMRTLGTASTVLVPASHEQDESEPVSPYLTETAKWLAELVPGIRIASVCTGAFVLAATGLLDGRRATTHWKSADHLRHMYPAVEVDAGVLYTDGGDVLTSAGEAAGIDLCLHIIRRDHGAKVANEVARGTVVPPHREGGQAQYVRTPVPPEDSPSTSRARGWALERLDRPLTLRELATRESMSVRTFTRHFRKEVGVSPLRWLTEQRIERARQLLEETDTPVEGVAEAAGFGTAASLRAHLRSALGVSPGAYRSTFRGPVSG